jgi:hypothetical protein
VEDEADFVFHGGDGQYVEFLGMEEQNECGLHVLGMVTLAACVVVNGEENSAWCQLPWTKFHHGSPSPLVEDACILERITRGAERCG